MKTFHLTTLLFVAAVALVSCKKSGDEKPAGVLINGVRWAECNVAAAGTFTANPESPGMIYQWNRRKAWSAVDETVTGWDDTNASGETWATANDPCPTGWRVPTTEDFATLLDTDKVTYAWTTSKGVDGVRFTDKVSSASIFLPAAGNRDNAGTLYGVEDNGYYWSSTSFSSGYAWGLSTGAGQDDYDYAYGFSVRCVKK